MMPTSPDAAERALAAVPLFADLPPDALAALGRASRRRHYPKGQILCSEADPGESLVILDAGQVRVSRFAASGQEVVLAVLDAPAAFGELALIDGAPRSATVTATCPLTVHLIERGAFLALVAEEPALAMALMRTLAGMVRATNERLADLLTLDVPGRLAKWLLTHASGPPEPGAIVPFTRSQTDLAAELGATRVSVNKALKGFEMRGVIAIQRDQIVLVKPDLLLDQTR
jgi:CRP/FNR family transcriptional regulator